MSMRSSVSLLLAASLIAACGGGGGGGGGETTPPPAGFDTSTLQGRWSSPAGATAAYTAIVLPGANNTGTAWVLAQDASRLLKLSLAGSLAVTGRNFPLDGSASSAVAGSFAATLDASPKSVSLNNVLAAPLLVSQIDTLSGMAAQADAAGNWQATAGAVVANWSWSDAGAISGSSSTGCTYAGNATTPTSVKVYAVTFTETCAGTATSFSGIATLSADKSRLTLVATSSGDAAAAALLFAK